MPSAQTNAAKQKPQKLSPLDAPYLGAFPDDMNMPQPNMNVTLHFKKAPTREVIITAFEKHLWPSFRFSSRVVDGCWLPREEKMDAAYHVSEHEVEDQAGIDRFVEGIISNNLDPQWPLWKVDILRARHGMSAVLIRIAHVLGDGLAMVFACSAMMDCEGGNVLATLPLPNSLLPPSARKPPSQKSLDAQALAKAAGPGCFCGMLSSVKYFFKGITDALLAKHDTETVLNAPMAKRNPYIKYSKRIYYRLPPVSMDTVKKTTSLRGCSVNDVLMAGLVGALRNYGAAQGDAKLKEGGGKLECKTFMMIGLPREVNAERPYESLVNNIIFASLAVPMDQPTPEKRLAGVQDSCNNLKRKSYMSGMIGFMHCIMGIAPRSLLKQTAGDAFSKHTLLVTNVPAPSVPITWPKEGGEVIQEIQVAVVNVMTQVSLITYNGSVYGSVTAAPELLPDPDSLGRFWLAEITALSELGRNKS